MRSIESPSLVIAAYKKFAMRQKLVPKSDESQNIERVLILSDGKDAGISLSFDGEHRTIQVFCPGKRYNLHLLLIAQKGEPPRRGERYTVADEIDFLDQHWEQLQSTPRAFQAGYEAANRAIWKQNFGVEFDPEKDKSY